jgi:hypothetical protein
MSDIADARVPKATIDEEVPETAVPDLAKEIAALEAEREKVLPPPSFNLRRGLGGGIPAGTFFMLGGVVFLVLNLLRHGLVWGYVLGALALFGIGLLLYVLSCWSRWRKEEDRRQSLLAVLDQQIERKRNELQRQGETPSG